MLGFIVLLVIAPFVMGAIGWLIGVAAGLVGVALQRGFQHVKEWVR